MRLLRHIGAPEGLLAAMVSFYDQRRHFVELDGAVSRAPICPARCPASMLCLIVDMTFWRRWTASQVPDTHARAYADDRTLHGRGPHAKSTAARAALATQQCETDAGWIWNVGKGASFSTGRAGHATAAESVALTQVGNLKPALELLRVTTSLSKAPPIARRECSAASGIYIAGLIALALPEELRKQDAAVRRAALLAPRTAGRAAFLSIVGPSIDLEFQIDLDSLRHQLWRLRQQQRAEHHGRWDPQMVRGTPEGELDLARDGKRTLETVAWRSHIRRMWQQMHVTSLRLAHSAGTAAIRRAALGCTHEHHTLEGVLRAQQGDGYVHRDVARICGAVARRQHWLWECIDEQSAAAAAAPSSRPRSGLEEKSTVCIVPIAPTTRRPAHAARTAQLEPIRAAHRHVRDNGEGVTLTATDGSIAEISRGARLRQGCWSAVVAQSRAPPAWAPRPQHGLDSSSAALERESFRTMLEAAAAEQVPVVCFIDNVGVQRKAAAILSGQRLVVDYGFGGWQEQEALAASLPAGSSARRVPSHGKRPSWAALARFTDDVRFLNSIADRRCGEAARLVLQQQLQPLAEAHATAAVGTAKGCRRLAAGEARCMTDWLPETSEQSLDKAAHR
ncbi:unnamed protein product, partial [Prorocentrum cordatum]